MVRRVLILALLAAGQALACQVMTWNSVTMTWGGQSMTWGSPTCFTERISDAALLSDRGSAFGAHLAKVSDAALLSDRGSGFGAHLAKVSDAALLSDRGVSHGAHVAVPIDAPVSLDVAVRRPNNYTARASEGLTVIDYGVGVYLQWKPVLTDDHYAIYVPQILFVVVKR